MENEILQIFKNRVLKYLKSREVKFILFGSRGRGDADEYSDYDLLIITSDDESTLRDMIEEIETDIFIERSAIINSHLFSREELNRLSYEPFIINALTEGIAA